MASNVGQFFLSQADAIKIPFYIRLLTITATARCHQVQYFNILHGLTEQTQLLQNDDFIHSQLPSLKNMHKTIEQDCRTIHSFTTS